MSDRRKAIWWFFPALLEPCDGPWGRLIDFGHDPVLTWRAIIDWAAALKVDRIITGIEPYASDRVYNQWGFHYVCLFAQDPAARCFDDEAVRRNIATVRAIAGYGRERGVGIMFHHYNLMAPQRWVQAHPGIAAKHEAVHDPVFGHRFRPDRLGNLVANVCWNEPEYRSFLERCWREVFANIPELAGAMITAGEFAHCGCDLCTGGTAAHTFQKESDEARAAEAKARRDQQRGEMCADLVRTFTGILHGLKKQTMVRTWFMAGWMDRLPKGIDYCTKYSVFDACWGGPDPVVHQWLSAGHRMWQTLAIEAENCGPVVWHDEQWCRTTAGRINDLDVQGCIIHINTQWGHTGHIGSFTSSRNITRVLESLEPQVGPGDSEREYQAFFGSEAGGPISKAARLLATFPLHMTATVHLAREGFSYGMPPWFDGDWRWPGVLGSPRYQAEPWANPDNLTGIHDLLQQVRADPRVYRDRMNQKGSAISRCDEIAGWCDEAIAILSDCPAPRPPAASELLALRTSAHIAAQAAREHACVLRARLAWEAVKHPAVSSADAADARAAAAEWYGKAIDHLARQIPWGLELARIYPDWINHVIESHETLNRLTMATRLRLRREELHRIRTVTGPSWDEQMTVDFKSHLPPTIGSGLQR